MAALTGRAQILGAHAYVGMQRACTLGAGGLGREHSQDRSCGESVYGTCFEELLLTAVIDAHSSSLLLEYSPSHFSCNKPVFLSLFRILLVLGMFAVNFSLHAY